MSQEGEGSDAEAVVPRGAATDQNNLLLRLHMPLLDSSCPP